VSQDSDDEKAVPKGPKRKRTLAEWMDDGIYRPELLSAEDREQIESNRWSRAGGGCVCQACGHLYYDHELVPNSGGLNRLCDGRLVHL